MCIARLRQDFEKFRNYCITLRRTHNTFDALYGDDDTQQILRNAAVCFFDDLHSILIESFSLQVGRMTEPAKTCGKENLSLRFILEQLESLDLATTELQDLAEEIEQYRSITNAARNKAVAHVDLGISRQGGLIGEHTKEEVGKFFASLNRFTDVAADQLGMTALEYSVQAGEGDVIDLVRLLKKATMFKESK